MLGNQGVFQPWIGCRSGETVSCRPIQAAEAVGAHG
jgi:hypothetical protein